MTTLPWSLVEQLLLNCASALGYWFPQGDQANHFSSHGGNQPYSEKSYLNVVSVVVTNG